MQTLHVDLGNRSYPIHIGTSLLGDPRLIRPHITGHQVAVVTNSTVAPLYLNTLMQSLSGLTVSVVELPDGEQYKTVTELNVVFDTLLKDNHGRTTTLVALGGGVVGDTCGFAAACYQRGVGYIQIPTTLLSQVDSSVGGKTGVNHALGKNMIGAFHQPRCVIADCDTLQSLPSREFASGLAEVIKYGLIRDKPFFCWLEQQMDSLLNRDVQRLTEAVFRSCHNKAEVVAEDEQESGVRALLNLGHTFGHAIETEQGYGQWLHGEAVAAGMVMAAELSARCGWLNGAVVPRLTALLQRCSLPVLPPAGLSAERFVERMSVDKKVVNGQLRLILLNELGHAFVATDTPQSVLHEQLRVSCARADSQVDNEAARQ